MLKCENISAANIINDISFEAKRGKFTAILGKNGSGKTTLAKCINSERSFNGSITLNGVPLGSIAPRERAKRVAYLPQELKAPNITVRELVSLGRNPYTSLSGKLCREDILAIDKAISDTRLNDFETRMIPTLSGGEKQRAYLAMMLAQDTEILLLDEPTSNMDMSAAAEFLELLSTLDKTIVVIMHDLTLALKHSDSVLVLEKGKQIFFGSKEECLNLGIIEKSFGVRRIECNGESVFLV